MEALLFVLIYSVADYNFRMGEIGSANTDLVKHCQFLEQEQLLMKVELLFSRPCNSHQYYTLSSGTNSKA